MHKDNAMQQMRIYMLLTLVYLAVAVLTWVLFYLLMPHDYFVVYPSISIFYWLCGMALNFFMDHTGAGQPDKMLNVFMMSRLIKFILTIVFLAIGIKVFNLPKASFAIALMCNYFIYTSIELYIYYRHNKRASNGH